MAPMRLGSYDGSSRIIQDSLDSICLIAFELRPLRRHCTIETSPPDRQGGSQPARLFRLGQVLEQPPLVFGAGKVLALELLLRVLGLVTFLELGEQVGQV